MISRIVFQLDVKKPFFIVCENGRHGVSVWAFTLRSKAVRVLRSYNENIRDPKLNQSAAHFTEPKSELTRSINKLPLEPWQCFFVQFVFLN